VTGRSRLFLLGQLGDHALGGEQQTRDGAGVLERGAGDLFRVHHAGFHEVFHRAGRDVVTFVALGLLDGLDDHAAFDPGVRGERTERGLDGAFTMLTPICSSSFAPLVAPIAAMQRMCSLRTLKDQINWYAAGHDTIPS
jgi:hypothetical protein